MLGYKGESGFQSVGLKYVDLQNPIRDIQEIALMETKQNFHITPIFWNVNKLLRKQLFVFIVPHHWKDKESSLLKHILDIEFRSEDNAGVDRNHAAETSDLSA